VWQPQVRGRAAGWVAFAAIAACAPPPAPSATSAAAIIYFANRSDTALAIAPDLLIPACGSVSTTPLAYEASRTRGAKQMMDDTWAIPPGAGFWNGVVFAGDPIQDDLTVVISSAHPPAVREGIVAATDLPACGGAPVGVFDEVVPEDGSSVGAEPDVTPLP
jgi:hypothetical protein